MQMIKWDISLIMDDINSQLYVTSVSIYTEVKYRFHARRSYFLAYIIWILGIICNWAKASAN